MFRASSPSPMSSRASASALTSVLPPTSPTRHTSPTPDQSSPSRHATVHSSARTRGQTLCHHSQLLSTLPSTSTRSTPSPLSSSPAAQAPTQPFLSRHSQLWQLPQPVPPQLAPLSPSSLLHRCLLRRRSSSPFLVQFRPTTPRRTAHTALSSQPEYSQDKTTSS